MPVIELEYDLEDVKSNFEPLPAGSYAAKIDTCELTTSSTGKPMLKIVWSITEGEHAGRMLFDYVVLSVGWKVKQYCELVGISAGTQLDTDAFIGVEAVVTVALDKDERNNIKGFESF